MRQSDSFHAFLEKACVLFDENCERLCALDAQAGDGDHGITIRKGIHAAWDTIGHMPRQTPLSSLFKETGYAMLHSMGGASGPIFSTFFIQTAIALQDNEVLSTQSLEGIITATIEALGEMAGAKPGDKTMIDALDGAKAALISVESDAPLEEALRAAAAGAEKGAESTAQMVARKGRAKYLGERSLGFVDAGATSVALIFAALSDGFGKESTHA